MVLPFRSGVNLPASASRTEWIQNRRRAEDLGFDRLKGE
ncbi:hypothetical protein NSERUTF1_4097 [Nocardia seriolae]|nr:hypothetical protein NSERUTF1_4097 [Nocardia seriolae]